MTETKTINPAVGVGCVVYDPDGRVLLVRRAKPPQAGFWHFPGGRLEPGETLAACCRREVLEETGIEVNPVGIIAVADRAIEGFHYIIIDFLAELTHSEQARPHPASDAADACWIHPSELNGKPLVVGLLEVIEASRPNIPTASFSGLSATGLPWLFTPPIQNSDPAGISLDSD